MLSPFESITRFSSLSSLKEIKLIDFQGRTEDMSSQSDRLTSFLYKI